MSFAAERTHTGIKEDPQLPGMKRVYIDGKAVSYGPNSSLGVCEPVRIEAS